MPAPSLPPLPLLLLLGVEREKRRRRRSAPCPSLTTRAPAPPHTHTHTASLPNRQVLSQLILGEATPLPVVLSLLPIMAGVALASAGELSFNWLGFLTAMASNLTFGFRAVWSKMVMSKALDSTALYAYTTLISLFVCAPFILAFELNTLQAGAAAAIKAVGATRFYGDLFAVGLLYHLYNQVSTGSTGGGFAKGGGFWRGREEGSTMGGGT